MHFVISITKKYVKEKSAILTTNPHVTACYTRADTPLY